MPDDIAKDVEDILNKVGDKVEEAINQLPGGPATADPKVAGKRDPKEALEAAMELMKTVLQDQGKEALAALALVSQQAAERGSNILSAMASLGVKVAQQKIDAQSATLAIDNYLEALKLVGMAEINAAKAQAYMKAVKLLGTVKSVLLALLQVALNIAVPGASAWVSGLNLSGLLNGLAPPA